MPSSSAFVHTPPINSPCGLRKHCIRDPNWSSKERKHSQCYFMIEIKTQDMLYLLMACMIDYLQTLRSSAVRTREFGKRATFKISVINFKMKYLLIHNCWIHNCLGSLSGLEKNFQTQRISEGGEFINNKKQRWWGYCEHSGPNP